MRNKSWNFFCRFAGKKGVWISPASESRAATAAATTSKAGHRPRMTLPMSVVAAAAATAVAEQAHLRCRADHGSGRSRHPPSVKMAKDGRVQPLFSPAGTGSEGGVRRPGTYDVVVVKQDSASAYHRPQWWEGGRREVGWRRGSARRLLCRASLTRKEKQVTLTANWIATA